MECEAQLDWKCLFAPTLGGNGGCSPVQ